MGDREATSGWHIYVSFHDTCKTHGDEGVKLLAIGVPDSYT